MAKYVPQNTCKYQKGGTKTHPEVQTGSLPGENDSYVIHLLFI